MKRRFLLLLLAALLICGSIPLGASAAKTDAAAFPFSDSAKHWAKAAILWGYENGVATGTTADTFSPNSSLTRGMFICFLARTARLCGVDVDEIGEVNPFGDVKKKDWYYDSALWGYENGIITGKGTDAAGKVVFAPNVNITRQETAAMMHRFMTEFLGIRIGTEGAKTFPDARSIASYARPSAVAMTAIGIFKGDDKGNFNPAGNATRAEAVTICQRMYDLVHPTEENAPDILPCI